MKILFDTDIGSDIDDALALLLLLRIPHAELVGVTTVYGCTDIRAKVAKKILDATGVTVPVIAGIDVPFGSPLPIWHSGTEGVGVLSEEDLVCAPAKMDIGHEAADFIIEAVDKYGEELTILSLGALTNIAASIRRRPSLTRKIGRIYFMGGGITYREPPPQALRQGHTYRAVASHNVRCDVVAAKEVLASGVPMTILTNDVTTCLWWDGNAVQELMTSSAPPEAAVVGRLLSVWLSYRSKVFGRPVTGTCPHDPLTVAEATGGRYVRYCQGTMHAHDDATTSFVPDNRGPHRAGVSVDAGSFLDWFSQLVSEKP